MPGRRSTPRSLSHASCSIACVRERRPPTLGRGSRASSHPPAGVGVRVGVGDVRLEIEHRRPVEQVQLAHVHHEARPPARSSPTLRPMGFGRCGERVAKTPILASARGGCTLGFQPLPCSHVPVEHEEDPRVVPGARAPRARPRTRGPGRARCAPRRRAPPPPAAAPRPAPGTATGRRRWARTGTAPQRSLG